MDMRIRKVIQSAFAFSLFSSQIAFTATSTWTGTTSDTMNTAGNWSPAGVPASSVTTVLIFPDTLASNQFTVTNDLTPGFSLNTLTIDGRTGGGATGYTITGGSFFSPFIISVTGQTTSALTPQTNTLSTDIQSPPAIITSQNGIFLYSGQFSGNGGLIFNGNSTPQTTDGVIHLTGNNSGFNANINITEHAILRFNALNNFPTGTISVDNGGGFGTLQPTASGLTITQQVNADGFSTFDLSLIPAGSLTLSNLSTISSSRGITVQGGGTFNLTGTSLIIGSDKALTVDTSTVVLNTASNVNTYTGATTITGGTLRAAAANVFSAGSAVSLANAASTTLDLNGFSNTIANLSGGGASGGTVSLGAGTLTVGNATPTSDFAGVISGTGAIIKQGSGTLSLSGTNNYTGTTTVSDGALAINGSITSATTVASGAILQGTGTITGAVVINGTMAPGNSIGTTTVIGNYTQATGSTFECEISPTDTDLLIVNGNATIQSGATFRVVPEAGAYPTSKTYTVLTTTGSILGTFDTFVIDPPYVTGHLFYQGSNTLELIIGFQTLANIALAGNANKVATALDQIFDSGDDAMDAVVANLYSLSSSELNDALNQLQPAQLKAQTLVQENNAVKVRDALFNRLSTPIYAQRCQQSARGSCCETQPCCPPDQAPWTVWVDGIGDWLHQHSVHYASSPQVGYHNRTAGVVLGTDYHFADIWNIGLLGAYTNSKTDWVSHHGHGSMDSGYFGVYASAIGKRLYAMASVIGAWSDIDSSRHITYSGENATAKGSTTGSQLTSSLDVGLNWDWKGFTFTPFDTFDYVAQEEEGFTEHHAGPISLKIRESRAILLRNELGLNVSRCECMCNSRWILDGKVSWVRETRIHGGHYTSSFVNTSPTFTVTGYMPDRSLVSPGASLTALFNDDRLTFTLYYNGLFGHDFSDNSVGAGFAYNF